MVYGEEDVPFKFAVHLTNTECRDMRWTLSGNRRLYPSILTKLRKYSTTIWERLVADHRNCGGFMFVRLMVGPTIASSSWFVAIRNLNASLSYRVSGWTHRIHRRHARAADPSPMSPHTQLDCTYLRVYIMSWDNSETTPRLCFPARRHRREKNTDIQVKVWQSFDSPSIALCNAPFNAPCSP